MVDKGLSVKEENRALGLVLHISLFAAGNGQMSVKEISFSKKDCSYRVHVEHVISREKKKMLITE